MTNIECPYVEDCPIFQYFMRQVESLYQGVYCKGSHFTLCARYKLNSHGQPVPPDLLPTGKKLHAKPGM